MLANATDLIFVGGIIAILTKKVVKIGEKLKFENLYFRNCENFALDRKMWL